MTRAMDTPADRPMVTVAICTWNRAALLRQTFDSFLGLEVPAHAEWRVLVVDNNSTDNTRTVVEEYAGRLPLRYVLEVRQGHSFARNRAVDEVASGHLLFTDDDVLVSPQWVAAFVAAIERDPEAAIFAGPVDPWFTTPPDPELVAAFPALGRGFCAIDETVFASNDRVPYGANMGFLRSALGDRRFRTDLGHSPTFQGGGEEVELCRRMVAHGARSLWCSEMRLRHYVEPKRTTLQYLKGYYRDGGRRDVRIGNMKPDGPFVAGMPRWMLRKWIELAVKERYYAVTGRRVQALASLRERMQWTGMLIECRSLAQASERQATEGT